MSLQLLIDMNLSPDWVAVLERHGWSSIHWSTIGNPRATDREIIEWAQARQYTVFTHDLDFGAILAVTQAESPSVLQLRAQDVLPQSLERVVVAAIRQHTAELETGALVVVDESSARVRVLPLKRQ